VKIPKFLKRKRNIWIIAILVVVIIVGYFIFKPKVNTSIQTGVVTKQNLQQTVLSTGQVVSGTELTLSFQGSGVVRRISAIEGDKVNQGQVLASLDQASALASLTSARGALAQAQANYDKLLAGTTPDNVKIYEDSVASAQHDLDSSYNSAINTLNDAYVDIYNAYTAVISIRNSYFSSLDQEGIKVQDSVNDINSRMQNVKNYLDSAQQNSTEGNVTLAISQMLNTLTAIFNDLNVIRYQCDSGIYYSTVSSTSKTSVDTQKSNINTAVASVTTAQKNSSSYRIALQKAKDQLVATVAPPTQADMDLAKAQILSAQGQVDSANATLSHLIIVAPSAGTITEVDIKVGEQATAMAKAVVLQDINNLHAEANVSEANIASLQVGQDTDYTFDALGPDQHFTGKILSINPASTVISGVVNYEVKGSLDDIPEIKPGMTANMTILAAEKNDALAVSSTAVINKNNKKYVRVVDDAKKLTYHEVEVQTGLQADGGLIEILSGLNEGQQIITYIKS